AAAEFIPVALLALPAGALADRHDRRKLLLIGQTAMMVMAAILAVLTHLGYATPAVIITLALLEGASWASVMPAWQALVPALVPREELPSAIALNSAQFNAARLLGPMIADALLHVGAHGYGALLSCLGTGAIVGALTLARLPGRYPRHHLIPLSMLGFALCAMLYASSNSFVLSGVALTVGGVFWVWSLASSNTAMQLLVPDQLRGRAMSVLALANTGALPLGHLLGGTLAHWYGARVAT